MTTDNIVQMNPFSYAPPEHQTVVEQPEQVVGPTPDQVIYHLSTMGIARVCHEANRAYCESMGDHSQPPWEEAPEWQRESAVEGVTAHLNAGGLSPARSHELWCQHKVTEGWRWGLKKDAAKRTHPCLVPFDQLSYAQRAKDYIFSAIVRCFLAARPDKEAA